MGVRTDIPPGTLYMPVLKSPVRLEPMHGYGIAQFLLETTEGVLDVEAGSLYPALQRMLLKVWVKGEWRQTEKNRRVRYYSLTAEGRATLRNEVERFDRVHRAIGRIIHPTEA